MGLLGQGLYLREEVGGANRTKFRLWYEWVELRKERVGLLGHGLHLREEVDGVDRTEFRLGD